MSTYTTEMEILDLIAPLEDRAKTVLSTEYNADGSINWNSKSLVNGAMGANAVRSLQQRYEDEYQGTYNQINSYNISLQREADEGIIFGIRMLNKGITDSGGRDGHVFISRGLKIIEWGLNRQEPNGAWESWILQPDPAEASRKLFHNMSFFLAHCSRALFLLKKSPYATTYPELETYKMKLLDAANYMVTKTLPDGGFALDYAMVENDANAHRYFLEGFALAIVGKLNGLNLSATTPLMSRARQLVKGGLDRQIGISPLRPCFVDADVGAFQEDLKPDGSWGTDTGYGCNSLEYAAWFYLHFENYEKRGALRYGLDEGVKWIVSRVADDGWISVAGNTRTCADEINDFGEQKGPHYTPLINFLCAWHVLDRPKWLDIATKADAYRNGPGRGKDLCVHWT